MDFPMDFGYFKSVSSMFCLIKSLLILNLTDAGVLCVKEIHRLGIGPIDLKIYTLAKTRDCDSTADKKIYIFPPKLSL